MPSNIILECTQLDGEAGPDASWTSTFKTPIPLEEHDVVQVKTALINTQSASSSNLVFESDQQLVITVGYYDVIAPVMYSAVVTKVDPYIPYLGNYSNNEVPPVVFTKNNAATVGVTSPVNGCYLLYTDPYNDNLFTTDIKFTIPAGSYSPDAIATLLTEGLYSTRSTTMTGDQSSTDADKAGVFIDPTYFTAVVPHARLVYPVHPSTAVGFNTDFRVNYHADATAHVLVGAEVVQVSFNQGKFEFAQLHTSPKSKSGAGTAASPATYVKPAVLSMTGTGGSSSLTAISGVCFTNLQPASFWDALGFSQSMCQERLYFNEADYSALGSFPARQSYFESRTTGQLNVNQDVTDDTQATTMRTLSDTDVITNDSSATRKLRGDEYISETNGYYLLEMETNFQTEYYDQQKRLGSTVAVISKQYNSADYITAYGDSAVPYVHVGVPSLLSSITLKIIDPDTKVIAKGLGGRSTVFVEVIRGQQPQTATVTQKKATDSGKDKK